MWLVMNKSFSSECWLESAIKVGRRDGRRTTNETAGNNYPTMAANRPPHPLLVQDGYVVD
jgi:hypothetical protein